MLCFAKNVWERLEDVDRFRNGLAKELYCLKVCRINKVHARSHEITKEPLRVQTRKHRQKNKS